MGGTLALPSTTMASFGKLPIPAGEKSGLSRIDHFVERDSMTSRCKRSRTCRVPHAPPRGRPLKSRAASALYQTKPNKERLLLGKLIACCVLIYSLLRYLWQLNILFVVVVFALPLAGEGRRPPARLAVRARLPRMRVQSASVLIDEFDADGRENGR